jgi:cardiolipin synthase A/B
LLGFAVSFVCIRHAFFHHEDCRGDMQQLYKIAEHEAPPELEVYAQTAAIWEAMYADCARAEKSIVLEQYIMGADESGRRFMELFIAKAKEGVAVRLLLDAIGSCDLLLSPALARLREAGGIVDFYNPVGLKSVFLPLTWLPRNHAKTLIVDDAVFYSGSACVRDDMASWRDLQLRLSTTLLRRPGGAFTHVVSSFGMRANPIYREILRAVREARASIRIVTPYFLPPWLLRRALRQAVKRGVEVQVVVSEDSDVPIAEYVSRSYYPPLLAAGVRIFHYQASFLHSKYVVVDEGWATVGSTNIDYLSLLRNRESNIFTTSPEAVALLLEDFADCMDGSREVGMAYVRRLPLWQRVLGRMGRVIRRIL